MNQTQRFKVLDREDLLNIGLLRLDDNIPYFLNTKKGNIGYNKTCPPKMKGILELGEQDLNMLNKLEISTLDDFILYVVNSPRDLKENIKEEFERRYCFWAVGNMLTKLNNNGSIRRIEHTPKGRYRSFDDLVCLATTYFPDVHYLDVFRSFVKNKMGFTVSRSPMSVELVLKSSPFAYCPTIRRVTVHSLFAIPDKHDVSECLVNVKMLKSDCYHVKGNSVYSARELFDQLEEDELNVKLTLTTNFFKNIIKNEN